MILRKKRREVRRPCVFLLISGCLSLVLLLGEGFTEAKSAGDEADTGSRSWTTVDHGISCGVWERGKVVVRDEGEWRDLLGRVYQGGAVDSELSNIDFTSQMILAVFLGNRSTGGYDIEIVSVYEAENELTVSLEIREPPPGALTTQILTQPYHIVATGKTDKEVTFQEVTVAASQAD